MAHSARCMLRGRPKWCSCSWTPIGLIIDEIDCRPLHWYAIRGDIAAMRGVLLRGAEVSPMSVISKPLHEAAQHSLDKNASRPKLLATTDEQ
jgi:hypothetical protein